MIATGWTDERREAMRAKIRAARTKGETSKMKIVLNREEAHNLSEFIAARENLKLAAQIQREFDEAKQRAGRHLIEALDRGIEFQHLLFDPERTEQELKDIAYIVRESDRIRAENAAYDLDAKPKAA